MPICKIFSSSATDWPSHLSGIPVTRYRSQPNILTKPQNVYFQLYWPMPCNRLLALQRWVYGKLPVRLRHVPGQDSVIVLAAALAVIVVIGAAGVASYTMSGQLGRRGQGTIERLTRFIPLPSLKIVIVVFQIVTQVILAHKSSRLKVCKLIFMVPSILGRMSPNCCRPW